MIGKLAVTALCAYSAFGCSNAGLLKQHGRLDIGVRLSGNSAFREAEIKALDYWASVLDIDWRQDETDDCSIEFRPVDSISSFRHDGAFPVAGTHMPNDKRFDGVVYFRYVNGYDKRLVFEHELGHLFGLEHNSDIGSVMYYEPSQSGGYLESSDLSQLKHMHSLR